MQHTINQNDARAEILGEFVRAKLFPSIQKQVLNSNTYLQNELKDFQNMENDCTNLYNDLYNKKATWSKNIKQLSDKNQRETDLQKRVEEYKKAKKRELVDKQQTIDALSSAMKDACSKIKPEIIAKLVPDENLLNIFKKLFYVLYDKPVESFDWVDFQKKGLLFEKGEDFQSRLANFPLKNVPQLKQDYLLQIQTDSQFEAMVENPKFTPALIDISEWITFSVNGINYNKEKDGLQQEYDKICKDFENRKKDLSGSQKGQEFWQSSFDYIDEQISFIDQMNATLQGISNDIRQSSKNLQQEISITVSNTEELNKKLVTPSF